jgi:hypothetical protein
VRERQVSVLRELRATADKTINLAIDEEQPRPKPVRDGQQYVKTELLRHLRSITAGMIEKAKTGGTAQLNLLWQLGKLDEDPTRKPKQRPPSLGKLLMDEVRKREAERKAEPEG